MSLRPPDSDDRSRLDELIATQESSVPAPPADVGRSSSSGPAAPSPAARPRTGRSPSRRRSGSATARGSKIYDVDGTEYVDLHGGYGVSLVGHAHPAIVARGRRSGSARGTHFAQPTEDAIVVAEELAARFGLPLWRFANSGTEATMDAVHLMRAVTGRDLDHQGRGLLPRPPRLGRGLGAPRGRRGSARPTARSAWPATPASRRRSSTWSWSSASTTSTPSRGCSTSTPARSPA